jgi:hypothetical protein
VSRDELDAAVPTMLTLVRAVAARAPAVPDGAPASMDSDDVDDDGTGV